MQPSLNPCDFLTEEDISLVIHPYYKESQIKYFLGIRIYKEVKGYFEKRVKDVYKIGRKNGFANLSLGYVDNLDNLIEKIKERALELFGIKIQDR